MSKQTFTTGQVLTAAQVNSLQSNDFNQTVSVKTASYVLVAADKGTRIEFNTSASVTVTVNSGLFDAGDTLVIQNRGAGAATVTAGTATVNTSASLVVKQYDNGVLYFVSDSSAIYFASDAADTPLTTKGDLFTFSTAPDRIAIGANNTVLTADSTQATGMKWAAAAAPSFVGCSIFNSTDFATNNNTSVVMTFNSENFDTDSLHSTSSNTSRITIPSGKGGKWLFVMNIGWSHIVGTTNAGQRLVDLKKNGSTYITSMSRELVTGMGGTTAYVAYSQIVEAVATDYFELELYQNSGNNATAVRGGSYYNNWSCEYLGA